MQLATTDEANGFSFWDFRNGDFHKGRGMRIDLAYVTAPVAERLSHALVRGITSHIVDDTEEARQEVARAGGRPI